MYKLYEQVLTGSLGEKDKHNINFTEVYEVLQCMERPKLVKKGTATQ